MAACIDLLCADAGMSLGSPEEGDYFGLPSDSDSDARVWANIRRQASDNGQGSGYQFTVQQQLAWIDCGKQLLTN